MNTAAIPKSSRRSREFRPVRWLIGSLVAVFAVLAFASTQSAQNSPPRPAPEPAAVSHELLQNDANMTEQMSTPNASLGPNHQQDAQLERSQESNYVRLLEQHQADVDRMLAQPTP